MKKEKNETERSVLDETLHQCGRDQRVGVLPIRGDFSSNGHRLLKELNHHGSRDPN